MQLSIDKATGPCGITDERVEIKDVIHAMAEAAHANVNGAEGEQKTSRALEDAADVINESPASLQMTQLHSTPCWRAQPAAALPMQLAPYHSATCPKQLGSRNKTARPMQVTSYHSSLSMQQLGPCNKTSRPMQAVVQAAAVPAVAQQQPMPNLIQAPRPVASKKVPPVALAKAASVSNYKYFIQNMCNPPVVSGGGPAAPATVAPVAHSALHIQGEEPLTPPLFASALPQEQKQMLGQCLFPLIHNMYPELADKITGMLLGIDNSDLLHMLIDRNSLKAKVEEALGVYQTHQAKQFQEPPTPSMLASALPQVQKQMLGECLFPLILKIYPKLACKITGMFLEFDNSDLLHILEDQNSLKAKVKEALAVLQKQKQMLGDRLFPLIHDIYPELACKITGMLLELDNSDLLLMLEDRNSLMAMVEKAVAVYQTHQANQEKEDIDILNQEPIYMLEDLPSHLV